MTTQTKKLAQGFLAILIVSLLAAHSVAQTTDQESQKKDNQPIQAAPQRSAPEPDKALNQIEQFFATLEALLCMVARAVRITLTRHYGQIEI